MKYFALLCVAVLKESICVVADEDTVVVLSLMSEWFNVALAVAKARFPLPSVFNSWLVDPSEVGNFNPLIFTAPDPLPESSRSALEALVETVLSAMVTPSMVSDAVVFSVVNDPAAGVVAPITVLSIVPLLTSTLAITTCPVPAGAMTRSELDCVVLIMLSVMLMFESTVRLLITTDPVPPGVKLISAFELEPIVLSLKVRLSMVVVPARLVVLVTLKVERVVSPNGTASVEVTFVAPESVAAPETSSVPSTMSPSLILIDEESSELNDVPLILIAPNTTEPVPAGTKLMLSFDLVPSMLFPLNLNAGVVTLPLPAGVNTRSSFVLIALISLPLISMASLNNGDAYISVKLSLTLSIATRKVSPVPSLAFDPMFSVCCAMLYRYGSPYKFNDLIVSVIYCS